ncbi:MAG: hypothetical protein WC052_03705 [Patescibacteria group bacterium]|jgi:hypothetical protein
MDKDDFFTKDQLRSDMETIKGLLSTGVFSAPILQPFQESSFVSIALKLHDLLQKLSALGHRIRFSDDISQDDVDITDLVSKIRNAICHLNSPENLLDKKTQLKFVFTMIVGKGNAISIGDKIMASSEYADDIAFYYGAHRLYLKRHLVRAINEAQETYVKLYPNEHQVF